MAWRSALTARGENAMRIRRWFACPHYDVGALLTIAAFLSVSLLAQPPRPNVSIREARKLVLAANEGHDVHRRTEVSQIANPYDSFFMYFEATWPNPVGSAHLGNYAVNPVTGDVYNTDGCERLQSSALKKLQVAIRERAPNKGDGYSKALQRRPICGTGD